MPCQRSQRAELQRADRSRLLIQELRDVFCWVAKHAAVEHDRTLFFRQQIERLDDLAPALAGGDDLEGIILLGESGWLGIFRQLAVNLRNTLLPTKVQGDLVARDAEHPGGERQLVPARGLCRYSLS
jgi:hypothetical protein